MRKAPWSDFNGEDIFEGSQLKHPSGEVGIVKFNQKGTTLTDRWLVAYTDGITLRLCLQIGDRGQATT